MKTPTFSESSTAVTRRDPKPLSFSRSFDYLLIDAPAPLFLSLSLSLVELTCRARIASGIAATISQVYDVTSYATITLLR